MGPESHERAGQLPVGNRRMHTTLMIALGGIAGFASLAPAQRRPEPLLKPGVRVRYELPRASHLFNGMIEEVDTLRIVVRPDGSDLRIPRSEEHTSELQSQSNLVCRLLLEKKK